jgi:hypothetical protein
MAIQKTTAVREHEEARERELQRRADEWLR